MIKSYIEIQYKKLGNSKVNLKKSNPYDINI